MAWDYLGWLFFHHEKRANTEIFKLSPNLEDDFIILVKNAAELSCQALQQLFGSSPSHHKFLGRLEALKLNITARVKLLKAFFRALCNVSWRDAKVDSICSHDFFETKCTGAELQPFSFLKLFRSGLLHNPAWFPSRLLMRCPRLCNQLSYFFHCFCIELSRLRQICFALNCWISFDDQFHHVPKFDFFVFPGLSWWHHFCFFGFNNDTTLLTLRFWLPFLLRKIFHFSVLRWQLDFLISFMSKDLWQSLSWISPSPSIYLLHFTLRCFVDEIENTTEFFLKFCSLLFSFKACPRWNISPENLSYLENESSNFKRLWNNRRIIHVSISPLVFYVNSLYEFNEFHQEPTLLNPHKILKYT